MYLIILLDLTQTNICTGGDFPPVKQTGRGIFEWWGGESLNGIGGILDVPLYEQSLKRFRIITHSILGLKRKQLKSKIFLTKRFGIRALKKTGYRNETQYGKPGYMNVVWQFCRYNIFSRNNLIIKTCQIKYFKNVSLFFLKSTQIYLSQKENYALEVTILNSPKFNIGHTNSKIIYKNKF